MLKIGGVHGRSTSTSDSYTRGTIDPGAGKLRMLSSLVAAVLVLRRFSHMLRSPGAGLLMRMGPELSAYVNRAVAQAHEPVRRRFLPKT